MFMINKQKLPLYIALCVPVLMIILVAAFIYLPGIAKKPKVNFLYMTGSNVYQYDYYGQGYMVSGGHLIYNPPADNNNYPNAAVNSDVHFYLYNVASNAATEVTLTQAQTYILDSSNTSSDGYTIQMGNGGGGDFLFGSSGGDYSNWYIKGNNRAIKLNLKLTGQSYENFRFLGWIE